MNMSTTFCFHSEIKFIWSPISHVKREAHISWGGGTFLNIAFKFVLGIFFYHFLFPNAIITIVVESLLKFGI